MKVKVHLDEQGNALAIERPQRGGQAPDKGAPQAQVAVEGKKHRVHELDLPDDLDRIEGAQEFYERLQPHLAKIPRSK